jgi:hypothetical protein
MANFPAHQLQSVYGPVAPASSHAAVTESASDSFPALASGEPATGFRADNALFSAPPLANSHLPLYESCGSCRLSAQSTAVIV